MKPELFWLSVLYSLTATIVGGAILSLIFFWLREKVFPLPNVSGCWYLQIQTTETAYKPYRAMRLRYIVMLWNEGANVHGTVEKFHEDSSTGRRDYVERDRTRGVVQGHIQKNYFSKDHIALHVVEDGHGRESTNFYHLAVLENDLLEGTFSSMVANQHGTATLQRSDF